MLKAMKSFFIRETISLNELSLADSFPLKNGFDQHYLQGEINVLKGLVERLTKLWKRYEKENKEKQNEIIIGFDDLLLAHLPTKQQAKQWTEEKIKNAIKEINEEIARINGEIEKLENIKEAGDYHFYNDVHLWAHTSRRATYIVGEKADKEVSNKVYKREETKYANPAAKQKNPSKTSYFPGQVHASVNLLLEKTQLVKTNPLYKLVKNEFKQAKAHHDKQRKEAKRNFLYEAKNKTAEALIAELINMPIENDLENDSDKHKTREDLKSQLGEIKTLKSKNEAKSVEEISLKFRKDCLEQHRKGYDLTAELKKFAKNNFKETNDKQKAIKEKVNKLITTLPEVTNRWIDPHFKDPFAKTRADKARDVAKILGMICAGVFGTLAFISLFTPFAPLAPIIGLPALFGLYPVLDSLYNTSDNAINYRQSPLNEQATMLKVVPIMLPTIIAGTHLPAVGHGIISASSSLNHVGLKHAVGVFFSKIKSALITAGHALSSKGVATASQDAGKYGLNAMMGPTNIGAAGQLGRQARLYSAKVKTIEEMSEKPIVSKANAVEILTRGDNLATKAAVRENTKSASYLYRGTDGLLHSRGSYHAELITTSFFRVGWDSKELKAIKQAMRVYSGTKKDEPDRTLLSGASLNDRRAKLNELVGAINNWEIAVGNKSTREAIHYNENKEIAKYKKMVEDELTIIDKLLGKTKPANPTHFNKSEAEVEGKVFVVHR